TPRARRRSVSDADELDSLRAQVRSAGAFLRSQKRSVLFTRSPRVLGAIPRQFSVNPRGRWPYLRSGRIPIRGEIRMGSRTLPFFSRVRVAARRVGCASLVVATVSLAACGGYGGSGSSYSAPSNTPGGSTSTPATGTSAPSGTPSGTASGSGASTPPPPGPSMAAAGPITVLGQTVRVTEDTSFDDDISPASLAGVTVGAFVEVSGMSLADGSIRATRIEGKMAGSALLQVIGTAASTDSTAKTLKINALVVDFSGATLTDFPATGPKDGDVIEVQGITLSSAGALNATRLELRSGK